MKKDLNYKQIHKIVKFPVILLFTMVYSSSFGQAESVLHRILENGQESISVVPVHYSMGDDDMTDWVENIYFSLGEDGFMECKITFKGKDIADYWFFKIDEDNNLSEISHENNLWLYIDDNATGTHLFQQNTGVETLDILFNIYHNEYHFVIQWKKKSEEEKDTTL